MPYATGSRQSQALCYGRSRFEHTASPLTTSAPSISSNFISLQQSNAGITRRAAPRRNLRTIVSAVGCMPLLDRPTGSGLSLQRRRPLPSGDLTPRITRRPAPLLMIRAFVSAVACMRLLCGAQPPLKPARGAITSLHPGPRVFACPLARPPHNARHHPPPRMIDLHESRRVGGRVHAVVRRGVQFKRSIDGHSSDGIEPTEGKPVKGVGGNTKSDKTLPPR
jgi:hypothetical protein